MASTNGFKLKETRPQNATVEEGGTIELYCAVDDWWEWCTFKRADAAICDFEWRKDVANVTVADCDAFDGRYEYFGDYNHYECGVRIRNARPEDAGEWRCDFESYNAGQTRYYGYKVAGEMGVRVRGADGRVHDGSEYYS